MMYQHDSQYCYDQTGLQLTYNGADSRGRPAAPHLQAGKLLETKNKNEAKLGAHIYIYII